MKITVLKYGESVFGENYIYSGGSNDVLLPITFTFYLIQTEGKNILVDAGCDECPGFVMSIFKKPVDVLFDYGLTPDDISDIIITHAHHDHIGALHYYKNALVHIQKNEYESGKKYIPDSCQINLFEENCTVANGVTAIKVGGHSIGSCIVQIGNYIICGDECYVKDCLINHIITGISCDKEKSEGFIKTYSQGPYIPLLLHDPDIINGKLGYEVIAYF